MLGSKYCLTWEIQITFSGGAILVLFMYFFEDWRGGVVSESLGSEIRDFKYLTPIHRSLGHQAPSRSPDAYDPFISF